MRKGFLGSLSALLTGAGLAFGQAAPAPAPAAAAAPQLMPDHGGAIVQPAGPGCSADGGCCAEPCVDCNKDVCGPPGRFWVSAEYLLWWIKDSNAPPLVATTSVPGAIPSLGSPGTTVLLSGNTEKEGPYSGGRITAGFWLNECQTKGIEGSWFFLDRRSNDFGVSSTGAPGSAAIGVPFLNVTSGLGSAFEDVDVAALAGVSSGSIHVNSSARLNGGEINGICNLCCCCDYRVDLLGGFRYLELKERLDIVENTTLFPTVPVIGGTNVIVNDRFDTTDRFYGGQLGVRGEVRRGNLFVDGVAKFALGTTHETVDINGSTTITRPGGTPATFVGGNFAEPSNIGHHTRDRFGFVPELGVNVGYQLGEHVRAFVGYTFLYWTDVARPGEQIDRAINISQSPVNLFGPGTLVGVARPAFTFKDSDFWAQGVNFGLEFRY